MELKLGHVGGPGSLFELSANEFARRANEKLGNKAKVVVFGSSQLGGDSELMQKLRLGTVEFAIPSSVMSSAVDAFGMFEMPYLVKNREHMKKIEADVVWPSLAPMAEAKGYKILAVWENGFRNITTNTKPIVKPADLAGMKLRVPQGKWRVKMFQAYGANPSPMALLRGVRRAADRRHGRPGEPADADLLGQVPGGAEVPVDDRPRLHAGLPGQRARASSHRCRPTCRRS